MDFESREKLTKEFQIWYMMIYVSIGIFEHISLALVSITGSVPFYLQVLRK